MADEISVMVLAWIATIPGFNLLANERISDSKQVPIAPP
ncbi:MAG: Hypothetical protein AJITA_00867 [Acetilactobacillus jinshanensis]